MSSYVENRLHRYNIVVSNFFSVWTEPIRMFPGDGTITVPDLSRRPLNVNEKTFLKRPPAVLPDLAEWRGACVTPAADSTNISEWPEARNVGRRDTDSFWSIKNQSNQT